MAVVLQTVTASGRANSVGSSLTITIAPAATTLGSLLVLCIQAFDGGNAMTINAPSGWIAVAPTLNDNFGNCVAGRIVYLENCSASITSISTTITLSGVNDTIGWDMVLYEISGPPASATLDKHVEGHSTGAVNSYTSTTAATTVAEEIVIASMGSDDNFQANGENISSGYIQTHDGPAGAHQPNAVAAYKFISATGTQSATWQSNSNGTSTANIVGLIATFKAGTPAAVSIGLQTVTVSQPAVSASAGATVSIGRQIVQYSQPAVTVGSGSGITVHIGLQTILVRQYPMTVRALRLDLAEPFRGTISVVQRSGAPHAATRQTGRPGAEG